MKTNSFKSPQMHVKLILIQLMVIFSASLLYAQSPPDPPAGTKVFTITVFMEGIYYSANQTMDKAMDYVNLQSVARFPGPIADRITVELHNQSDYSIVEFTQTDVNLLQDGTAVAFLPETGVYYLTVKNRNHLETVSAVVIDMSTVSSYNFSSSVAQAYGSNQALLPNGLAAMYSGDVNQDGVINVTDRQLVNTALIAGSTGYIDEDIDGNGVSLSTDRAAVQSKLLGNSLQVLHP